MKEKFLNRIKNPAVKKELRTLFNNGFSLNEEHFEDFASRDLSSNLIQIFPTVNENQVLKNIKTDLEEASNIFLVIKADQGLYWKATELVEFISERSKAEIVWNFHPTKEMEQIMRIVTVSY